MRLIDAKAGKKVFNAIARPAEYKGVIHMVVPISEIDKLPTVDAVEVVRCKDCEHCFHLSAVHQDDISCSYFLIDYGITPDHFCSYGERRSDGKET